MRFLKINGLCSVNICEHLLYYKNVIHLYLLHAEHIRTHMYLDFGMKCYFREIQIIGTYRKKYKYLDQNPSANV